MSFFDETGTIKIDAARRAASILISMIQAENQAIGTTGKHQVGLVQFNQTATVLSAISNDLRSVQNSLSNLEPFSATAMADGLRVGIDLLDTEKLSNSFIILLSDGMPNVPLGSFDMLDSITNPEEKAKQDVLDLGKEAGEKGFCVYTVGFGDPTQIGSDSWIDEDFLRSLAQASKCGQYFNARDANQLSNVFINMRHMSMGTILLENSGVISQGQTIDLGKVAIPSNQQQALITLNWPGSRLIPNIIDPEGIPVRPSYPGVSIDTFNTLTSISIDSPKPGDWGISITGEDVPEGIIEYHLAISIRALTIVPTRIDSTPLILIFIIFILVAVGFRISSQNKKIISGGSRPAYLSGIDSILKGKIFTLSACCIIGRGSDCHIKLSDLSVSRHHAQIYYYQRYWVVEDLQSKGGTFVNQRRISREVLHTGDLIQIGNSKFMFHLR